MARPKNTEATFETLLTQIESIVVGLEKGDQPLEDSLTSFESGVRLIREAQMRLEQLDARLERLTADGAVVPLSLAGETEAESAVDDQGTP